MRSVSADVVDARILEVLQCASAPLPVEEVARRARISMGLVHHRLKQLWMESRGVGRIATETPLEGNELGFPTTLWEWRG